MLTMGLSRLVLVNPKRFPDPDATAMASGATAVLDAARIARSLDEALVGCVLTVGFSARPREFAGRVMPVRAAAAEAAAMATHGEVGLVFGGEMSGLSNQELAHCGLVATIARTPSTGRSTSRSGAGGGLRAPRRGRRRRRVARAAVRVGNE